MIGKILDAALMLWQSLSVIEKSVLAAWALALLLARIASAITRNQRTRERAFADYLIYRLQAAHETPAA